MFCDLVGSTPLAARYDPEDLREIVGAYHRCVADTAGRFAGFVAKYMGDGVLIYFGYPEAHEDDAERAVRAGLAVIDAVARLAAPEPLRVRLGIASGLVVVGDLIGEGAAQERGVVGETPNLAARLQALAGPGTLVIAESTRRQIGGLFELLDLGPQPIAGFAEPQRVWHVVRESGVISRFEALRSEAYRDTGRPAEGLHQIAEALDHVAQTGIVYYEAELHRLDGQLRLCLDPPDEQRAETSFRRALDIARPQKAKAWELRAATSLARLWGEQGRRREGRDLLASIYGWFTEGFNTADLKEAKALLDELT
jgi:class 3 adenylate cyclase